MVAMAALLVGCGGSAAPIDQGATLVLDFTPNAIHVGVYTALARTFDQGEGVHLHVIAPSASTDSVKLLETGRADFAILDIHDLAIARARGADVVGIMALVERPLASLIAVPSIASPGALQGKTVGVSGLPSDTAVLRSIISGAGGNPRRVRTVTIGFNAVPALLSGRVAGATAFWNDEGVTITRRRPGFHIFRVDRYGAPAYPELVLCATRATLRSNPTLAHSVVRALVRGYGVALTDPEGAAADLESRVPGLDPRLVAAELGAIEPAFVAPDGNFGEFDLPALRAWARWEKRFGIVKRLPDVTRMFDPRFVAGTASLIGS
jgi:NitT/TauT family transport system substrate-binding protein/putative hydroxymethylpyrimidine transport system substrate-binding protein